MAMKSVRQITAFKIDTGYHFTFINSDEDSIDIKSSKEMFCKTGGIGKGIDFHDWYKER